MIFCRFPNRETGFLKLFVCALALLFPVILGAQSIEVTETTGSIRSCFGTASSTYQSFTVSGSALTGPLNISSNPPFEVALATSGSFGPSITLLATAGVVTPTVIFVRVSASAAQGRLAGTVSLKSENTTAKNVSVVAQVDAMPKVHQLSPIVVKGGETINGIVFTSTQGTAAFSWTNDNPSIGLAPSGEGYIKSFRAVNTGMTAITSNVTVSAVSTPYAYMPSGQGLSIVNALSDFTVSNVQIGENVTAVAAAPDGSTLYASDARAAEVLVIDTRTNLVVQRISVAEDPDALAVSGDGKKVYVCHGMSDQVSIIDAESHTVLTTVSVGDPRALTVSLDGARLYVSTLDGTIVVINALTNSLITSIPINGPFSSWPEGLAVTPDGTRLYAANRGLFSNTVSIINTSSNQVVGEITIGNNPHSVAMSADGKRAFVSNTDSHSVSVIDTDQNATVGTIPTGQFPSGVALSSDGTRLFVLSQDGLEVFDTSTKNIIAAVSDVTAVSIAITSGTGCASEPVPFTIQVNPSPLRLDVSAVRGQIYGCAGTASADEKITTFLLDVENATEPVAVKALTIYEIATSMNGPFSKDLALPVSEGKVSTTIFVRSAASAPEGIHSEEIMVSVNGTVKSVAVRSIIRKPAMLLPLQDLEFDNGAVTEQILPEGSAHWFDWTNSNDAIGLPASGSGVIPSFLAQNANGVPGEATITVTPSAAERIYIPTDNGVEIFVARAAAGHIPLVSEPNFTAISPTLPRIYLGHYTNNAVSVLDSRSNEVISTIPLPGPPHQIIVSPDGKLIYCRFDDSIGIIDAITNKYMELFKVSPYDNMALHPLGTVMYLVRMNSNTIDAVDLQSRQIIKSATVGIYPRNTVVNPAGTRLYVSDVSSFITVLDCSSMQQVATVPVGGASRMIFDAPGDSLYIHKQWEKEILVVDAATSTISRTISLPARADGFTISADGRTSYLLQSGLSIIDNANGQVLSTIDVENNSQVQGQFVTNGTGCAAAPVTFKITIKPGKLKVSPAAGKITACAGSPSTMEHLQYFSIEADHLASPITVEAPLLFEVSTDPNGTFSRSISIPASGAAVVHSIYVRASANSSAGKTYGKVRVKADGVQDATVSVWGQIDPIPVMDDVDDVVFTGGTEYKIDFRGQNSPQSYIWENSNAEIGLETNGTGSIAPFYAFNSKQTQVPATITVRPVTAPLAYIGTLGYTIVENTDDHRKIDILHFGQDFGYATVIHPDGTRAYVTSTGGELAAIHTGKNEIEKIIDIGESAHGIAVSPDGQFLFVTNNMERKINVIDTRTLSVTKSRTLIGYPGAVCISPDGDKLYIANGSTAVLVLDSHTLNEIATIGVMNWVHSQMAISDDGDHIYLTGSILNELAIIDTRRHVVTTRIKTGESPTGIALSPDHRYAYVSCKWDKRLDVIDLLYEKLVRSVPLVVPGIDEDLKPHGIAITPNGAELYVGMARTDIYHSGRVYRVNTETYGVSDGEYAPFSDVFGYGKPIYEGGGCIGEPQTFEITVNSGPAIFLGDVSTPITVCQGDEYDQLQSFTTRATNLEGPISISAPIYFEIANDPSGEFVQNITLSPEHQIVPETTIYMRLITSAPIGHITSACYISSPGAQPANRVAEAIVYSKKNLTSKTLPSASVGRPYEVSLTTAVSDAEFTADGLPEGLSIDSQTGKISGIPVDVTKEPAEIHVQVNGPCEQSAVYYLSVIRSTAWISISNTEQTYDGSARSVQVETVPADIAYTITYNGSSELPVNPGEYEVHVSINTSRYQGDAWTSLVIQKESASILLSDLIQTYTGSPLWPTVQIEPVDVSYLVQYGSSADPPTLPGKYMVSVIAESDFYVGSVTAEFIITKVDASIAIEDAALTYNGQAPQLQVTTSPVDLAYKIYQNRVLGIPKNAGTYTINVVIDSEIYSGESSANLIISKAPLQIKPKDISIRYLDGLPLSFPLEYNGFVGGDDENHITIPTVNTNAGATSPPGIYDLFLGFAAAQNYAIEDLTGQLTILKALQTVTFDPVAEPAPNQNTVTLAATATSGLPISFEIISGPASVAGNVLTVVNGGEIILRAYQAGNEYYERAEVYQTFFAELVTSVGERPAQRISVYPNPARSILHFDIPDGTRSARASVIDAKGVVTVTKDITLDCSIDISHLPRGPYVLKADLDGKIVLRKIILE
jgi:YVTN family beta-propeller protein